MQNSNTEQSNATDVNGSATIGHDLSGGAPRTPRLNPNGMSTVGDRQISIVNFGNNRYRARQGSFDINQTLTYRKVMSRVIKRFLLHKQREEQEEIREGDFDELKQDIQMLRIEMLHRLDETRESLVKNTNVLNEGVITVGDLMSALTQEKLALIKQNFYALKYNYYSRQDSGAPSVSSSFSATSLPTMVHTIDKSASVSTSHSIGSVVSNDQQESDINLSNAVRHLSVAHVKLSDITEEEENYTKSLKYIDDDDDADDGNLETQYGRQNSSKDDEEIFKQKY